VPTEIGKLAKIFKVLGDANRLGIVMSIGKDSHSVTEIINSTGLSQTLVSFHLRTLRNAEIVKTKRNGPFIYYRLSEPGLIDNLSGLLQTLTSTGSKAEGIFESIPNRLLKKQ
jgi:DNA-binding transcriptional ArsR family regulator